MRGALINAFGLCINVIEYSSIDDLILDGVSLAPDNTGEIGWTWSGARWVTPSDVFNDLELTGLSVAETPALNLIGDYVATTAWVNQKIAETLYAYFGAEFSLNGGAYSDADGIITLYNAGRYDGTLNNLTADLDSPIYDGTGGNLVADIDAGAYV